MENPPQDDIILPEATNLPHLDPSPESNSKSGRKKLIFAIVAFVVLVAAAVVILVVAANRSDDEPVSPTETSVIKYDASELQAALSSANDRLEAGDYSAAKFILDNNSATERMTTAQRYRYYDLMRRLYLDSALGVPELAARYSTLAEETRQAILNGEE